MSDNGQDGEMVVDEQGLWTPVFGLKRAGQGECKSGEVQVQHVDRRISGLSLKSGSACSGIGDFPVAGPRCGLTYCSSRHVTDMVSIRPRSGQPLGTMM